ncbi:ring-1,2-phenylacetyl-CoA epoxidase subunit PaaD [Promicromonospora thailandica]|uniref:Ring-1,2-phenylacetyl-CoA epoxidase subunit PaaD n=1 Tax=Promicromonospora thailandica TaxID=765201 RepID=A0A9X2JXB0_9MICO|nr:1,2-phenylacetyl-CoA epoxidase subunit PaaD [Promicromonospora thailandica]MCP2263959.1 ring-1,2-phenylacetyl-CoA epoxidase subunit PaaD [Promicromonospora thailandica]
MSAAGAGPRHAPGRQSLLDRARAAAAAVVDPELPVLTLLDLGVLRDVEVADDGAVVVAITPTYSGCPAMGAMRDDLLRELRAAGLPDARVRVALEPAWTTDWITPAGRAALAEAGISPPGAAPRRSGPVPLRLGPPRRAVRCPRCGSGDTEVTSEFGSTACKALYRCRACREPFDHVKEI